MSLEPNNDLLAAARSLADGQEIDWAGMEGSPADVRARRLVAQLRILGRIS